MLQEKLQTVIPVKEEAGEKWVDVSSTRVRSGVPMPSDNFNQMPVGYDATSARASFGSCLAGADDVSGGVTPKSLKQGFDRKPMNPADPQYTGEQAEQFYGDAGGFCERNNYLDRI